VPVNYGSMPFNEAVSFFRRKLNVPARSWDALWQHNHDVAFMVAGATQAELIKDLRELVRGVIENGDTLRDFRKGFDQVVARRGWGYKGGRNWRTRVIYETNLYQAYNAGRERQIQAIKHRRPYAMYEHNDAVEHPREEHLAWDGLVLPVDDPWWDTHTPQNGWGCRCRKVSLSERDLRRMGKAGPDQAPPIEWEEKRIGVRGPTPRTVRVPKGIDPGFAYAPGQRYGQLLELAAEKAGALEQNLGAAYIKELIDSQAFARWYASPPAGFFPIARLPDEVVGATGAHGGYAAISAETARKQALRHPDILFSDYARVQQTIDRGERIRDGSAWIYLLEEDGFVSVIKSTASGRGLFLSSFRRLSSDAAKRDREIRRLRGKR